MCNDVSFVRAKSFFKIAISIFLCFCIILIPFIQRSYAVVTTTTVVVILILTLLTAMGITLVIADGTKEAFIEQKGDEFMQSKGYSGSFADWIKGQSDIQIGLKVGFLMLAKDVVDRIKEFVGWLIPGAVSNTTINLSNGEANAIDGFVVYKGTVNYSRSGNPFVTVTSVGTVYTLENQGTITITGTNTSVVFETLPNNETKCTMTNGYDGSTGNLVTGVWTKTNAASFIQGYTLLQITEWTNRNFLPGIYLTIGVKEWIDNNYSRSVGFLPTNGSPYYSFNIGELTSTDLPAAAIIGDYDNLSDLTQTTVTDNGTTTIYNTFYITQDGQALTGSGQDIADIVGSLQQALDDLNRKLEVIPQTAETAAEGTITPDYSDFDLGNLDLSGLGALLTTRFPFSIPWDIIRIFQTFVAEPEAPSWTVDLLPLEQFEDVNTEITIDLGQYPLVGQISRYFCIIELCIGLCYVTKRLVWTA